MKNVAATFLFGSGADTNALPRLKSGQSFASAVIQNKFNREIRNITGIDSSHFQLIYPTSRKVYIQTVIENEEKARHILGDDLVNIILAYNSDTATDEQKKLIKDKCLEFYNLLTKPSPEASNAKDVCSFFLENAVLYDSLDEKFNSLRNTDYNANAKRVINAYYTVFLTMVKDLYDVTDNFEWSLENIYNLLNSSNVSNLVTPDCYYDMLRQSGLNYHAVTTNYTYLSEHYLGADTSYLHGKLTWFEDLDKLTVYDCSDPTEISKLKNATHCIPFILIPSGIKPIICSKQLQEFEKFLLALRESHFLVIVGYRFNSEDNHINSIIANWLAANDTNKLMYLNYNNGIDFKNIRWAADFSVCEILPDNCTPLISASKITSIFIDKDNCHITFKTLLSEIAEHEYH